MKSTPTKEKQPDNGVVLSGKPIKRQPITG